MIQDHGNRPAAPAQHVAVKQIQAADSLLQVHTSTAPCDTSVQARTMVSPMFLCPIILLCYEQAFSHKSSTFVGDATLKPSSLKYWGEVRYHLDSRKVLRIIYMSLFLKDQRKFSKCKATTQRISFTDTARAHGGSFYLMMNYDSIAATLTGFITFTMFLMCSNPMTITPMR